MTHAQQPRSSASSSCALAPTVLLASAVLAFTACGAPDSDGDASTDASTTGASDASAPGDAGDALPDATFTDASLDSGIPPTCGNNRVELTESCDDGNHDSGDGCSPFCTREARTCSDALSLDAVATRTGPSSWHYVFAREDATHVPFRGDDCGRYGDNAVLLEMTPDSDGALVVEPTGSSNSTISILAGCDDAFSTLACTGHAGTSARVSAGERVYIEIHPGDPPYDFAIRLDPFVDEGGACDFFHTAVCAPPLVCAALVCADACGDGNLDIGEDCDDGNRSAADGCAPDCTLEPQPLAAVACGGVPTELVFVRGRDGALAALAFADTSTSTTRDPSCTTVLDASPTIYFQFPMADGDRAQVDVLGDDAFAPMLRRVAGVCGPASECRLGGSAPGGFDTLDLNVRGPHTVGVSGSRGPGDQGRVRILVRLCQAGVSGCSL